MKSILIRIFALAMLASSISALAANAPSKDNWPKKEKKSVACPPVDSGSMQQSGGDSRHDRKMKKMKKMKKDQDQQKKDAYDPTLGIWG